MVPHAMGPLSDFEVEPGDGDHDYVRFAVPRGQAEAWARDILEALHALTYLGQRIKARGRYLELERRNETKRQAWYQVLAGLCLEYDVLRFQGIGHRLAVRSLASSPRWAFLQWDRAAFARIVRDRPYPTEHSYSSLFVFVLGNPCAGARGPCAATSE